MSTLPLQNGVQALPNTDRYRQRIRVSSVTASTVVCKGRRLINFCSNDYLGLAHDPELKDRFKQAVEAYGVGAGSSQYISGYSEAHEALEETAAAITGYDRTLCFASGYMANMAIQSVLMNRGDHVFVDRLAHASIYDAAILSRSKLHRYPHLDCEALEQQLDRAAGGRRMIVTDGVFSMDGDTAPLPELSSLASSRGACLVVDDAHGFGVVSAQGAGTLATCRVPVNKVDIYMATLGKACGAAGAFVAADNEIIEQLQQHARTLIYTTAMPPAVAAVATAGMNKAFAEDWRRKRLYERIQQFRQGASSRGLALSTSETPIQPLVLHGDRRALEAGERLFEAGFLVRAIRPPTVPEGTARLRITLSAAHSSDQVEGLLDALARVTASLPE